MAIEARPALDGARLGRLTSPVLVGRERELGLLLEAAVHPPAVAVSLSGCSAAASTARLFSSSGSAWHVTV
jgi:hypothetical protein